MRIIRRIISGMLFLTFVLCLFPHVDIKGSVKAETNYMSSEISIGDTITLGTYNGEPVVWRCVLIDDNGPLMMADDVLCAKEYDAAGENSIYHTDGWGDVRRSAGSNCWYDSNIRQWLNSNELKVEYTHCPPSYSSEAGFLTNFSPSELSYIKKVTRLVNVNVWESQRSGYCDGGGSDRVYSALKKASFDAKLYYYKYITDAVFLISAVQFNSIYNNSPKYLKASSEYWTCSNYGNDYACYELVSTIDADGSLHRSSNQRGACDKSIGVRPAFFLKTADDLKEEVSDLFSDINMGPYAIQGAEIDILGYKIPLIDLEASVKLNIGDHVQIIAKDNLGEEDGIRLKVLLGFDQDAQANIQGNDSYWSDAYKEVKTMYQNVTGKRVDTTRLWNQFSSLRGKLKTIDASMLVSVSASLAGYAEFQINDGAVDFIEGGILASFEAKTAIKQYYGPCYVSLGLEIGAEGSLVFADQNNEIVPQISIGITPAVVATAGVGLKEIGTYAEVNAFGKIPVVISTAGEVPLRVGLNLGVTCEGYLLGNELFSEGIYYDMQLYPEFGATWSARSLLTGNMDVSDVNVYRDLINSATPLERNYLITTYALRGATLNSYEGVNFEKHNLYTLSSPNLVRFDDDTMLLVWVDDTGEKTSENRCSLMYSFYNGTDWSEPAVIYEDGMMVDMPYVYSDGQYAYIVWQKASIEFDAETELTDTLSYYDLYATVFDSSTQTFAENVCITPEDETTFELSPIVYGNAGAYKVAWVENTDNNIYQMSGTNTLYVASYDASGVLLEKTVIHSSAEMFTDYAIDSTATVFSVIESGTNVLYYTATNQYKVKAGIHAFEYVDGVIFYTDTTGLRSIAGDKVSGTSLLMTLYTKKHNNIGSLDEFSLIKSDTEYVIFYDRLNEDFSKSLYYSKLSVNDTTNTWTDFEVYSANGTYIRNYSPVVLSNGEVHVAFNYIVDDGDTETASLVVDQCTDMVDLSTAYVVFEDAELVTGTLNLKIGIENHSSKAMTSFDVMVFDSEGNLVLTKTIDQELKAFEETELTLEYELPQTYANEIYSVQVMPCEYDELDETNNVARTTFECIHSPSEEWTIDIMPTTETTGIKSRHCLHCDEHLDECEVPVITTDPNLVFSGASITLFDDLTVNFKAAAALFETYTDPYVVFVQNGIETTVTEYAVEDGYVVFAFADILPNQMNDEITATMYATLDGTVYMSEAKAYSVATYCYNMLDKYSDDEKLRTLLVDILNYGAATQEYTDHNTANLANAGLTDAQKAWASPDRAFVSVENVKHAEIASPAVAWIGAGLNLSESIAVRYEFTTASTDGLTAKVTCGGKTWEIAEFSKNEQDKDVLLVYINAGYMNEPIYVTLYDGETAVSDTVCYSIESYASTYGEDAELGALVKAMMKYGDAASAYITKG